MEVMCFKWHPSLFFPDPISLYLSISSSPSLTLCASPCPSVMALVHPHVYLCYKAEESGRLKMKTPTREHLCVHFVNAQMRSAMCARVCEYALFYPFWIEASFLYSRVEFLSTSPHTAFLLFQPSPFLSSPAQISATDRCLIFLSVPDRTGESDILI